MKNFDKKDELKIDLVYSWVNGNDVEWQKKKFDEQEKISGIKESFMPCRFRDNNELMYSLRSVEKYIPWINHIYIITDNQVPEWLDVTNPKISVIDHKDIIPNEYLPTFNSRVIEHCMVNIPNLSEYFLYSNDDNFVCESVTPDFFFTKKGKPIYRFSTVISNDGAFAQALRYVIKLVNERYNILYDRNPHHNIDPYKKSDILDCYNEFKDLIDDTIKNKFRTVTDVQRFIYHFYSCAMKRARYKVLHYVDKDLPIFEYIVRKLTKNYRRDSMYISLQDVEKTKQILSKVKPRLFCLNDNELTTDDNINALRILLEDLFPEKSSFEK